MWAFRKRYTRRIWRMIRLCFAWMVVGLAPPAVLLLIDKRLVIVAAAFLLLGFCGILASLISFIWKSRDFHRKYDVLCQFCGASLVAPNGLYLYGTGPMGPQPMQCYACGKTVTS